MPLKLVQRGNVWHYSGTLEGERLRGTTGCKKKSDAARELIKITAKEAARIRANKSAETRLTFARAAILYRKAGKTTRFIEKMEDLWGNTPVDEIRPGKVQQAAIDLYPKASGATRNRHVIVPTQAIINHASSLDLCPPLRIKRFKTDEKIKTPATWEWVQAFMKHSNPHLGAICCFMFLTGARVSEAIAVTWGDVNFLTCKVLIKQTKVGKERMAHLPPELVSALQKIEGERSPDAKVFKYSTRHTLKPQWEKVFKRAGIERLTFHCCRHGFATTLLHKGVDPITVAKLGGWADAQLVFKTYGHAMRDETLSNMLTDTKTDTVVRHSFGNNNGNQRLKVIE